MIDDLRYVALLWALPTSNIIMISRSNRESSHQDSKCVSRKPLFQVSQSKLRCKKLSEVKERILFQFYQSHRSFTLSLVLKIELRMVFVFLNI